MDLGCSEALSEILRRKSPSAVMAFRKNSCCLCSLTQQYTHKSILHCLHLMLIDVTGVYKPYIYVPDVDVCQHRSVITTCLILSPMDAGMGVVGAASCCSEVLILLPQLCVCTQKFKASFKTAFVSVLFMKNLYPIFTVL